MNSSAEITPLATGEGIEPSIAQHIAKLGHNSDAAEAISQDESINPYERAIWSLLLNKADSVNREPLEGSLVEYATEATRLLSQLAERLPGIKTAFVVREKEKRLMDSSPKIAVVVAFKPAGVEVTLDGTYPGKNGVFLTPQEDSFGVVYKSEMSTGIHSPDIYQATWPRLDDTTFIPHLELISDGQISPVIEDSFPNLKALIGEPTNWPAEIWIDGDFREAELADQEAEMAAVLVARRAGIERAFKPESYRETFTQELTRSLVQGTLKAFMPNYNTPRGSTKDHSKLQLSGATLSYVYEMLDLLQIDPKNLRTQVERKASEYHLSVYPKGNVTELAAQTHSAFIKEQALKSLDALLAGE